MTDDELVERLVAAAPRPTREQVTRLVLLLTSDWQVGHAPSAAVSANEEAPSASTASGALVDHFSHSDPEAGRALSA